MTKKKENMLAIQLKEFNDNHSEKIDKDEHFSDGRSYAMRFTRSSRQGDIEDTAAEEDVNVVYKKRNLLTSFIMFLIGLFIVVVVAYRCSIAWIKEKFKGKHKPV